MKGFLSLVLVSVALLQMTAAAPTVSERSQDVEKRFWDLRFCMFRFLYMVTDNVDDEGDYLVLVLFLSVLLTHSVKHAVLDNPE
ncbi:hypothetical protein F4604DRAFT_1787981, partial [Suillus subluteus]